MKEIVSKVIFLVTRELNLLKISIQSIHYINVVFNIFRIKIYAFSCICMHSFRHANLSDTTLSSRTIPIYAFTFNDKPLERSPVPLPAGIYLLSATKSHVLRLQRCTHEFFFSTTTIPFLHKRHTLILKSRLYQT